MLGTSPHITRFPVPVIPGVGIISGLQLRTRRSDKEKQAEAGLKKLSRASALFHSVLRRHKEGGEEPRDTQQGGVGRAGALLPPDPVGSCP